jgi:hypothetical protein
MMMKRIEDIDGYPYGKWTTTPPTQEGWYWAMSVDDDDSPQVVIVDKNLGTEKDKHPLIVGAVYVQDEWQLSLFTHWLGPLPVPAPPKE